MSEIGNFKWAANDLMGALFRLVFRVILYSVSIAKNRVECKIEIAQYGQTLKYIYLHYLLSCRMRTYVITFTVSNL